MKKLSSVLTAIAVATGSLALTTPAASATVQKCTWNGICIRIVGEANKVDELYTTIGNAPKGTCGQVAHLVERHHGTVRNRWNGFACFDKGATYRTVWNGPTFQKLWPDNTQLCGWFDARPGAWACATVED